MSQKQTIALDAMGGDFGPEVILPAAHMALHRNPSLSFILFGDQAKIAPLLDKDPHLKAVSTIVHTDKIIASDEKPSLALRNSKDTSMRMAIEAVKDGRANSVVSAGNTGALMAIAKIVLRPLPGIERPALASVFPTQIGTTVMLDLGANVSCDSDALVQFAILGSVYARIVKNIEIPTVGLLNVGTEEQKGHDEVRQAASILSSIEFPGRYYGFIEGSDITKGTVDVVVTDGFTGNIALKTAEGVSKMASHYLRLAFKSSPMAMAGYFLAKKALQRMKDKIDPRIFNGGMFLGLNGICVKSHGGSDDVGTMYAILAASRLVENGFNKRVCEEMEALTRSGSIPSPTIAVAE